MGHSTSFVEAVALGTKTCWEIITIRHNSHVQRGAVRAGLGAGEATSSAEHFVGPKESRGLRFGPRFLSKKASIFNPQSHLILEPLMDILTLLSTCRTLREAWRKDELLVAPHTIGDSDTHNTLPGP